MSPTVTQALQRLLVIAVVGALSAVGLNLTVLNGTLGANAVIFIPVLTAIISAALKFLGGPTTSVGPVLAATVGGVNDPPPFWAV